MTRLGAEKTSAVSGWEPPPYSEATQWAVDHDCFVDKDEECSHLFMDGFRKGKAYIHTEDLPYFYEKVLSDARRGKPNYIVELKSRPVFPFCLDIDCEDERDLSSAIVQEWIPLIQQALRDSLPDDADHELVACRAPSKVKKDKIKTGFHLHFSSLLVDTPTALQLRSYIITRLQTEYGPRPEANPWTAVVDRTVLTDNGFRLLWSWKCGRCTDCPAAFRTIEREMGPCRGPPGAGWKCPCAVCAKKKEKRQSCPNKCSYGKIAEKREYVPLAIVGMDGTVYRELTREECLDPAFAIPLMWMTCVRWPDDTVKDPVTVTVSPPSWYTPDDDPTYEEEKRKRKTVHKPVSGGDRGAVPVYRRMNGVPDTAAEYLAVSKAVRRAMNASVSRLYCEGEGLKRVYQAWSHHRVCANKGGEHESNNVWFEITCRGVSQRCHDEDCRGFVSVPVPLSPQEYKRLFMSSDVETAPLGADKSTHTKDREKEGERDGEEERRRAPLPKTSSKALAGMILGKVAYDPSKTVYGSSWKARTSKKTPKK